MKLHAVVLLMLACLCPGPARADFFLIVNAGNPQSALTQKEAVDLFMGRQRSFPRGEFALMFDLPRDSPQREAFYKALTGMSLVQVNSYWARLMFAGQSLPPQPLPNETAMLDIVRLNPSALGWVSKEPNDKQIRTVLVLKDAN
jgi:hypothetical protein